VLQYFFRVNRILHCTAVSLLEYHSTSYFFGANLWSGIFIYILRRIFVSTKENQIWRVKTKEELDKLIKHKIIINYFKAQILSWFCNLQRMPDTRTVKKIFNWKPLSKRSHGRPKHRWEYNIKQDICQKKLKNCIACIQDWGKWKEVIEKTKTLN